MRLWNSLFIKLGLRKPAPQISRSHALAIKPIHNPNLEWRYNEEDHTVASLTRRAGWRGRLVSFFLMGPVPEERPVILDEVGTFVWKMCDGQHTVGEIVDALCEKYNLTRREVEISLNEYLRMLAKRGMIVVAVPKDILQELDEPTKRALGIQQVEAIEELEQATDGDDAQASDSPEESNPEPGNA